MKGTEAVSERTSTQEQPRKKKRIREQAEKSCDGGQRSHEEVRRMKQRRLQKIGSPQGGR